MSKIIGCIGYGNMGSAILNGFAARLNKEQWSLCCYDAAAPKLASLGANGIIAVQSVPEVCQKADILIFAVKPQQMPEVLEQAQPYMGVGKIAISIAAGIGLSTLREQLGAKCCIVRCMPTTTAKAGRGVFALCFDPINLEPHWQSEILKLLGNLGYCQILPESQFTNFTALIGAGPAYVFEIMHSLMQAGITLGFQAQECRQMLIELFAGCASLAQQDNTTFMQLRDNVCSPAGITIAGVNSLDRAGITGIMVDGVLAAATRGSEMES